MTHFGLKTNQDITMVCSDQNKTVCQAMQRQYSLSLPRLSIITDWSFNHILIGDECLIMENHSIQLWHFICPFDYRHTIIIETDGQPEMK